MPKRCARRHGVCKDSSSCSHCRPRTFGGAGKARRVACWAQELNGQVTPFDVALGSLKKYWFTCDATGCGHDFDIRLDSVKAGNWCPYCDNKLRCADLECALCTAHSFAGCTYQKALRCWSVSLNNNLVPRDVALNCGRRKYWFTCDAEGCGHEFETKLSDINAGSWCPYCSNKLRCDDTSCAMCTAHSFAGTASQRALRCWSISRNNGLTPRDIALNCNKRKYWFTCDVPECGHEFDIRVDSVNSDRWCPYCENQKRCTSLDCVLCTAHSFAGCTSKQALRCWFYDKNNGLTPRDVALNCNKRKYWFKCDAKECGYEFDIRLSSVNMGKWCPGCRNKTERKLVGHLRTVGYACTTQYRIAAVQTFPFDVFVPAANVIIELDGPQHFIQVANWRSQHDTRNRDVVKMVAAHSDRRHLVRIYQEDVWFDRNAWAARLDQALSWLATQANPTVLYITAGSDRWDRHAADLAELAPEIPQYMMDSLGEVEDAAEAVLCRAFGKLE